VSCDDNELSRIRFVNTSGRVLDITYATPAAGGFDWQPPGGTTAILDGGSSTLPTNTDGNFVLHSIGGASVGTIEYGAGPSYD
jgi:hypothetical protein